MIRRGRFAALHAPAGSQRAGRGSPLRRPPTLPIQAFTRVVTVPIGNDGISAPIPFTAGGTAQAVVGPSGVGSSWSLDQANAYTSVGALDAAKVALYVGPQPMIQYQVAAFLAGGAAQVALGGIGVDVGWFVWALWTGGAPGATAHLYVTGNKTALIPG